MLEAKTDDKHEQRSQVLKAYRERASLHGLGRIFGVARESVVKWVEEHLQH